MDHAVWPIVWLSVQVSGCAVLIASLIGLPLGGWLGSSHFKGRNIVWAAVYTGMALPPVVVGLLVYLLLSLRRLEPGRRSAYGYSSGYTGLQSRV